MLRVTGPTWPRQASGPAGDWVFLFESSGDRDPLLARAQIEVIRTLLDNAGARRHLRHPHRRHARPHVRRRSRSRSRRERHRRGRGFLEKTHLVGALDLGKRLDGRGHAAEGAHNPYLVHVGSGIAGHGRDARTTCWPSASRPARATSASASASAGPRA